MLGKKICILRSSQVQVQFCRWPAPWPLAGQAISPSLSLICDLIVPGLLSEWWWLYVCENKKRLSNVLQTVNILLRWNVFWGFLFRLSVTHLNEVISLLCLQRMYISHGSYNCPVCVSFHNYIFASQVSGFVFVLFRCQTWTWHSSLLCLKNDNIHTFLVSSLLTSSPCLSSSASRTCSACGRRDPWSLFCGMCLATPFPVLCVLVRPCTC